MCAEMLEIESWPATTGNTMRGFRCFPLQMFSAVAFLLLQLCTSLATLLPTAMHLFRLLPAATHLFSHERGGWECGWW
jgi:hypothetical protein